MTIERNYDFRRFLDEVHRRNRRDFSLGPRTGEMAIDDGWCITLDPACADRVLDAARDLQDYLLVSMGVSLSIRRGPGGVPGTIHYTLEDAGRPRGFLFEARGGSVLISGHDPAGALQGGIHLEDLLNLREGPFLEERSERREPLFSPRMVHSGWGLDEFPDSQLNAIVHAGFDSILVFVKGVDRTRRGVVDLNDLVERAERHTLGVYLYSYLPSWKHPDEPDADAFFEASFGSVFQACPRARGLILVGESVQFPSRDPDCLPRAGGDPGICDPRENPGWWPAADYPRWLDAVKRAVRRHQPEADIVFWTYNWGRAPEEPRIRLIRSLPGDVTLQATFEMFEVLTRYPNHTMVQPDYSITFPGPGRYFASEAQAAKERGLKLYSMTNTAGTTWDFGTAPYEPMPQQWLRRFRAVLDARRRWGLSGLMESHHYGWYPSPVPELAKWCFWTPAVDLEDMLRRILARDFGAEAAGLAYDAYQAWSDAVDSYTPGFDDQAGPLRSGPAYPFIFRPILYPNVERDMVFPTTSRLPPDGVRIRPYYLVESIRQQSWQGRRIPEDIRIMTEALPKWEKGVALMRQALEMVPPAKQELARKMAGVGSFCHRSFLTMLNNKKWWLLNKRLEIESGETEALALMDRMDELIDQERRNAQETIPLVEADSRLGWEPSMDYVCDAEHLRWKLRQLDNLQNNTLKTYRKSIAVRPRM